MPCTCLRGAFLPTQTLKYYQVLQRFFYVKKFMNKWGVEFCRLKFLITFAFPDWGCSLTSESSSADRAPPCQGGGRGFEPRLPLNVYQTTICCSSGGIGRHARLKILCPLGRMGSSPISSTKGFQSFLRPFFYEIQ